MRRIRVIPALLVEHRRLVKTVRFGTRTYVGDPINTVKIFNEKRVDELMLLDIAATRESTDPDFEMITEIASECFMPVAYGGGISDVEHAKRIFGVGIEKIVINDSLFRRPDLITDIARIYGNQAVVASIDARKNRFFNSYHVVINGGRRNTGLSPIAAAQRAVQSGAGEIIITNVSRDGTKAGYDLDLIRAVADAVTVPVIASGGAGSVQDFTKAVLDGHASAVAAGALFVFTGPHKAVLVNYPSQATLCAEVYDRL